eukprot:SAG31_NODE_809_length_11922_cov_15.915504_2_plen_72_part_00
MRIRGFDKQAQPLLADKYGTLKAFVSGMQSDSDHVVRQKHGTAVRSEIEAAKLLNIEPVLPFGGAKLYMPY